MRTVDKISVLPEPILHHILSFLSFKHIAQARLLSKTWNQTWLTIPIIEFRDIYSPKYWRRDGLEEKSIRRREQLKETLQYRHERMISLNKFTLLIMLRENTHQEYVSFINQCVKYAIAGNVEELAVQFTVEDYVRPYTLPQMALCSKSIKFLVLRECKLDSESVSNVKLPSLRKLHLREVYADHDLLIQYLIVGCPLIEDLQILHCTKLKSLELLKDLDKLKEIRLYGNRKLELVEIKATNVRSMDIIWQDKLHSIKVNACSNLNVLNLHANSISDELFGNHVSKLPLLESLSLEQCMELKSIKISCPRLQTLIIRNCYKLVEIKIETPRLSIFKYKGGMISFSSTATLPLSDGDLCFDFNSMDNERYSRYVGFLANFNHVSTVLNFTCDFSGVNVPRNLRKVLHSPLPSVKHLKLKTYKSPMHFPELDDLLWISPHVETISIEYTFGCYKKSSFQFTYVEERVDGCCKTYPVSCWHRCIKKVKIQTHIILGVEDGNNIKMFSFEGEEILKNIVSIKY